MDAIYKMDCDCGREGTLTGIFIADDKDVFNLIESKKEVYFGEVLGKHSEIVGALAADELIKVTDDVVAIELFKRYNLSSGYNPFDYIEEEVGEDYEEIEESKEEN